MPAIKLAIKSLSKRKLSSILFIAQLTITIFILNTAIIEIKANSYQENQLEKYLNLDINKTMHLNLHNTAQSEDFRSKFIIFERFVNSLNGVEGFGGYDLTNTSFKELKNDARFLDKRRELTKGSFKEQYPDAVELFKMDQGIDQLAKLEIAQGRNFQDSDFDANQKILPILIGNEYSKIIELKQIITDSNTGIQYKVIGFIGNNSHWFSDGDYIGNMMISLSDKFIVPYSMSEKQSLDGILTKSDALFYTVNNASELVSINNTIENKANELNLGVECKSIREELLIYKQDHREIIFYNLFICLFLGGMSVFGLITVTLSTVLSRKREFGIRIVTGASKSYIKCLIIEENLIIIAISALIANLTILIINHLALQQAIKDGEMLNPMKNMSIENIFLTIVIVMGITFLSSIIPIQKINALKPAEMIGGNDR